MQKSKGRPVQRGTCLRALLGALLVAAASPPAPAGELFRCGKTFQDRPCETADVQQRFSRTQGTFAIEQVHPDTDHACARTAAQAMSWWERLARGESMDKLQGEIQARNISRAEKSLLRDSLTDVGSHRGTPKEVRSQLELECMAARRRNLAGGVAAGSHAPASEAAPRRAGIAERRAAVARARAEAARERMRR